MTENQNSSVAKANVLLGLQFLSDFGDQITTALLALCVLDITQSTSKVGLVYFITTAGYVIFTLLGGYIGDCLSRRNILFFADTGRGLIVLLLIVAIQQKSIGLIYIISFLLSIFGSLHGPVKVSTWTEGIPAKHLESYNSLSELSIQASTILGPLIASYFIAQEVIGLGFTVDAMTFFMCAIVFSQIVSHRAPIALVAKKKDFLKGFKIIAQEPQMWRYIAYDAVQMLGFGAFNATFLVLAQRDFGWSKTDYSYHLTIVALFTTIGAFCGATRWVTKMNPSIKLIACALLSGATLYLALRLQHFPATSFLVGICDGLTVLTMAVTRTRVQLAAKNSFPDFLASVIASRSIIIKAATLLGVGACLILDDFISLESTLTILITPILLSAMPFFGQTNAAATVARVRK